MSLLTTRDHVSMQAFNRGKTTCVRKQDIIVWQFEVTNELYHKYLAGLSYNDLYNKQQEKWVWHSSIQIFRLLALY